MSDDKKQPPLPPDIIDELEDINAEHVLAVYGVSKTMLAKHVKDLDIQEKVFKTSGDLLKELFPVDRFVRIGEFYIHKQSGLLFNFSGGSKHFQKLSVEVKIPAFSKSMCFKLYRVLEPLMPVFNTELPIGESYTPHSEDEVPSFLTFLRFCTTGQFVSLGSSTRIHSRQDKYLVSSKRTNLKYKIESICGAYMLALGDKAKSDIEEWYDKNLPNIQASHDAMVTAKKIGVLTAETYREHMMVLNINTQNIATKLSLAKLNVSLDFVGVLGMKGKAPKDILNKLLINQFRYRKTAELIEKVLNEPVLARNSLSSNGNVMPKSEIAVMVNKLLEVISVEDQEVLQEMKCWTELLLE